MSSPGRAGSKYFAGTDVTAFAYLGFFFPSGFSSSSSSSSYEMSRITFFSDFLVDVTTVLDKRSDLTF